MRKLFYVVILVLVLSITVAACASKQENEAVEEVVSDTSAYLIVNIKMNDPSWIEEYTTNVPAILSAYGGEYVFNSGNIEVIEGESDYTDFVSVVKFPSKEAALGFEKDEKYAPYLELRKAGTEAITYLIGDN